MDDSSIVELYFARSEQAIQETDTKYGGYCYSIAYNILANQEDSEESVNDTYLSAWNSIPPRKPNPLAPFLGKIVRHISIDMWRKNGALKRGGGEMPPCSGRTSGMCGKRRESGRTVCAERTCPPGEKFCCQFVRYGTQGICVPVLVSGFHGGDRKTIWFFRKQG